MSDKPSLLYISPVVPRDTGNGLAMRAGMVLEILAEWYRIRLLVYPLYLPGPIPVPPELARLCEETAVVPITELLRGRPRGGSGEDPEPAGRAGPRDGLFGRLTRRLGRTADRNPRFTDVSFDVVHIFRLAAVQFANPYLTPQEFKTTPRRHLDLDDIESRTLLRTAELYRANGLLTMGAQQEAAAEGALAWENQILPQVDRICVCSETDRREILTRFSRWSQAPARPEVCLVPNAVRVADIGPPSWEPASGFQTPASGFQALGTESQAPASGPPYGPKVGSRAPAGGPQASVPFLFLFVGTLGYYPNQDALTYFCNRVWPLIRREALVEVDLVVVGAGVSTGIMALTRVPCVRVIGEVPEVEEYYRHAHAVIVPVRAGGGTRIKVLEAFGYRRPVVSTSIGIEGIEARGEEHVLLGDTPQDFARQCLRLTNDLALRERLVTNAFALFKRAYTPEAVARTAAACLAPQPGSGA
jgi:glycosyltransferase involved in cell wall biosynthesis